MRIGSRGAQAASVMQQADALARACETAASREAQLRALQLDESTSAFVEVRTCRVLIAETWRVEGELSRALTAVQAELAHLHEMHSFGASHSALAARMAAYRVLAAAAEPEAAQQLELAMRELESRLGRNSDPGRPRSPARRAAAAPPDRGGLAGAPRLSRWPHSQRDRTRTRARPSPCPSSPASSHAGSECTGGPRSR